MIARIAVEQQMRPGCIIGYHAADSTLITAGRVWSKAPTDPRQMAIQFAVNHTGLHPNGTAAGLHDRTKMAAEIDNDARSESFSRQAAARSTRNQRNLVFGGIAHQSGDIFFIFRKCNAKRLDLENTGIRAIQNPAKLIKEKFSFEETFQIVPNMLALLFDHRVILGVFSGRVLRTSDKLDLFPAYALLAVSLSNAKIEGQMRQAGRNTPVMRRAPITNNGILHGEI